jgi:non-ribosomal peptide synthetase component E (peptide arylation enzyme)
MDAVRFPIDGVTYHSAAQTATHRESGAWVWSTLGGMLREAAATRPDHHYITAEDGTLTFAALDRASESVAASMLDFGLKPGDRAIFQVGTIREIVIALFGCFKAGIVPVCTLPQYREIEIGQLTDLSQARAYFVQVDFNPTFDLAAFARRMMAEHATLRMLIVLRGVAQSGEHSFDQLTERYTFEQARARTRDADPLPGDVALFQLSGGSTSIPKIIPRMHAEYLGSSAAWDRRCRLGSEDVSLWALPLIHNAGMLLMLVPSLIKRRTLVIRSRFEIEEFFGAIERHRVTFTGSIGPIASRVIEFQRVGEFDISSLRSLFALSRADGLEERTGILSSQMFGITEGMIMGAYPDDDVRIRHATMGWPTAIGDEVRLLEPGTEKEVATGATGEMCFRGPHTLCAYYNAPTITAQSFTSDGFFRSGDLMRAISVNGCTCYFFEGRLKDNVDRGGEKFGAEEVENIIVRHPAVNDARVVAMPDALLGERACAFLIIKSRHRCPSVASLGEFLCGQGLAKFKLPERIEQVNDFPVTRVGKVDKQALRTMIASKLKAEVAVSN